MAEMATVIFNTDIWLPAGGLEMIVFGHLAGSCSSGEADFQADGEELTAKPGGNLSKWMERVPTRGNGAQRARFTPAANGGRNRGLDHLIRYLRQSSVGRETGLFCRCYVEPRRHVPGAHDEHVIRLARNR